jgi:single-strand DNA-binding protein
VSAKITAIGNVVNSPSRNRTQNGSVTNFRMAATDRRFDSATQEWVDGHTFFVDVECWGEMGGNVSQSVSKGDPVIVIGSIRTHEWDSDQGRRSRPQVRAEAVALNLARGTAEFTRTRAKGTVEEATGAAGEAPSEATAEQEQVGGLGGELTSVDYETASEAFSDVDSHDLSREPATV